MTEARENFDRMVDRYAKSEYGAAEIKLMADVLVMDAAARALHPEPAAPLDTLGAMGYDGTMSRVVEPRADSAPEPAAAREAVVGTLLSDEAVTAAVAGLYESLRKAPGTTWATAMRTYILPAALRAALARLDAEEAGDG